MMKNSLLNWLNNSREFSIRDRWAIGTFLFLTVVWYAYGYLPIAYLALPKVLANQIAMIAVSIAFFIAIIFFLRSNFHTRIYNNGIWPFWVVSVPFICIGIAKGMLYNHIGRTFWLEVCAQAGFCISLYYVIMMGRQGALLEKLFNFFLVMYYLTVLVMFFCQGILMTSSVDEYSEVREDVQRNVTSMAYLFKSSIQCAPFFFLAGCFWRKRMRVITRLLCLAALIPYGYFIVYYFKFRGGLLVLFSTCAAAGYYLLRTAKIGKLLMLGALLLFGGLIYSGRSFDVVRERVTEANARHGDEGLLGVVQGERFFEATLMFEQFSISEIIFGRGYNASFDASEVMGEKGYYWKTLHLGFLSNVLRNGIVFSSVYFLVFLVALFKPICRNALHDGLKVSSKCFVFVETIHYLLDPMMVAIYHVGSVLILYLCLGVLWSEQRNMPNRFIT